MSLIYWITLDYLQQKVEQEVQKCIFLLLLLTDGGLEAGGKLHNKVNDTFHSRLSGVHDQCVFQAAQKLLMELCLIL